MKIPLIIYIFCFLLISLGSISAAEISPALQQAILEALEDNRPLTAVVFLKDQVDIDRLDKQLYLENATQQQRAYTVITALQEKAASTQLDLINFLNNKSPLEVSGYQNFWIANFITVKALPAILYEISEREDIELLDIEYQALKELVFDKRPASPANIESVEPGLKVINAHKLWALGYSGAGTLVMNCDTGVDGNHPALSARWRGTHVPANQAWYGPGSFPTDNDDHGTHTMGTITGYDPVTGDTVGVAPAAEWIAAGTIGTGYSWVAAFQWAMDPDGNPLTTDDMPDVISNSFYIGSSAGGGCLAATYSTLFNSVEAAGIAIVWSAGNAGPGIQTITSPKNINTNLVNAWATGNINGNDPNLPIRTSSSRGPSGCGGTGSLLIRWPARMWQVPLPY
jgi:subtilisin family serine protease